MCCFFPAIHAGHIPRKRFFGNGFAPPPQKNPQYGTKRLSLAGKQKTRFPTFRNKRSVPFHACALKRPKVSTRINGRFLSKNPDGF